MKFAKRYDMTRAEVLASIMSDRVAATTFAKTASRQRIAEKSQFDYLNDIRGLKVKKLLDCGKLPDVVPFVQATDWWRY